MMERVFDWLKAAKIIADRKPDIAEAGLAEDWGWTAGVIWKDGRPTNTDDPESYTFLGSTWATPVLVVDGEQIECFVSQAESPGWDEKTFWPGEARRYVGGGA
jgi:hypothetical protein